MCSIKKYATSDENYPNCHLSPLSLLMAIMLISIALGLFVGLVLALTGAGGAILAVPLLTFFLPLTIAEAAPIGLFAVLTSSIAATIHGLKMGAVRYRAATVIAFFGILFVPLGIWMSHQLPNQVLTMLFALILIYVARHMWRQAAIETQLIPDKPSPACVVNPATSKLFWTASCTKRLIVTGSVTGFLSGLVGVGGGFIIVPTLHQVTNLETKSIVATTLAVVALISVVSFVTHTSQHGVNMTIAVPFGISALFSMLVCRALHHTIPSRVIQRMFAGLALLAAMMLLVKNYGW